MTTIKHDGIVEFVRQYPPLAVELLRHIGTFALPDNVTAELGSEDMTDVAPRANGGNRRKPGPQKYTADSVVVVSDAATGERLLAVVVEPQGKWAEEKGISWPVYAATARKANKCPRAVVITVCWDRAEAGRCRRIIASGHPGLVFIPLVVSAGNPPPMDGASPYLILFNTVIGAVDLGAADGRERAITAINATGANFDDHRTLCHVILGVAANAAREHLEELMSISYRSEFVDGWFEQGEARAKRDDILRVLKFRSLRPGPGQRERIESCNDLATLDAWFECSFTATTVDQIFEDEEDD